MKMQRPLMEMLRLEYSELLISELYLHEMDGWCDHSMELVPMCDCNICHPDSASDEDWENNLFRFVK